MKKQYLVICGIACLLLAVSCKQSPPTNANKKTTPNSNTPNEFKSLNPTSQPTKTLRFGGLRATGINSVASMKADLKGISDKAFRMKYNQAFRLIFAREPKLRNYAVAGKLFQQLIKDRPNFAPAYRGMGYVVFNTTFNWKQTNFWYRKALAKDPKHGESHYALAFMLGAQAMMAKRKGKTDEATKILAEGKQHYEMAIKLGLPDSRRLGMRYFGKGHPKLNGSTSKPTSRPTSKPTSKPSK